MQFLYRSFSILSLLLCGCVGPAVQVFSVPSDASIVIDGAEINLKTPAVVPVKYFDGLGRHSVTVTKDDYEIETSARELRVQLSGFALFWTLLTPPIGIPIELLRGSFWKEFTAEDDILLNPPIFMLREEGDVAQRLKTLDRLKAEGVVTEEEYRKVRKEIVDDLPEELRR